MPDKGWQLVTLQNAGNYITKLPKAEHDADETAVRWLILLMVLCCDPAAIALTIAVAGLRRGDTVNTHT